MVNNKNHGGWRPNAGRKPKRKDIPESGQLTLAAANKKQRTANDSKKTRKAPPRRVTTGHGEESFPPVDYEGDERLQEVALEAEPVDDVSTNNDDGQGPTADEDIEDYDDTQHDHEESLQEAGAPATGRQKYKPDPRSPLGIFLAGVHDTMLRRGSMKSKCAVQRFHFKPFPDPLSKGGFPNPIDFLLEEVHCFDWRPFGMFGQEHVGTLKSYCCVACGGNELESKAHDWRPMFEFNRVVWLHHRRVECQNKDCNATFAECDPRFHAQLPAHIQHRLPFLTTVKGPGIHQDMLHFFESAIVAGCHYGTFVRLVNRTFRFRHDCMARSYYEMLSRYKDRCLTKYWSNQKYRAFPPFFSVGHYNGILLSANLLRTIFVREQRVLESYRQKRVQMFAGQSASSDHTHKFARSIRIPSRGGKAFTASFTVMDDTGHVVVSRMTHSKSNDEIRPIIKGHLAARENALGPSSGYKRLETDGGPDRSVWKELCPSLSEGVEGYTPPPGEGLVRAELTGDDYLLITDSATANNWAQALGDKLDDSATAFGTIAIDAEWDMYGRDPGQRLRLLQVGVELPTTEDTRLAVFDLKKMNVATADQFPVMLRRLILNKKADVVLFNGGNDRSRLREYGVNIRKWTDVRNLATGDFAGSTSLQNLSARCLGIDVNKQFQRADYSEVSLPQEVYNYAAMDVVLTLKLYAYFRARAPTETFCQDAGVKLQVGKEAVYRRNRRDIARVEIVFVGGGELRSWGGLAIGRNKCLVRIVKIYSSGDRIPFSYEPTAEDVRAGMTKSFPNDKTTIKEFVDQWQGEDCLLAVHAGHLFVSATKAGGFFAGHTKEHHQADSVSDKASIRAEPPAEDPAVPEASTVPRNVIDLQRDAMPKTTGGASSSNPSDSLGNEDSDDDSANGSEAGDEPIRSRMKADIFHVFQNNPLKHRDPVKHILSRLLIHSTFVADEEDFDLVAAHLKTAKGLASTFELLTDFYHNREWWRRRVRYYTPKARDHAARLVEVRRFMTETFPGTISDEVEAYFDSIILMAQQGLFEELDDVGIFKHDGVDSNGLNLWLRLRGSNKAENFHKKLEQAFGEWAVGPITGHFLMILVVSEYNANATVRRNNGHDFGHCRLDLVDDIDLLTRKIFGVTLYPRHDNAKLFDALDFVGIGIGVLEDTENLSHLSHGPPMPSMGPNLREYARFLGVTCPPLPIDSKEEKAIFNSFLTKNPSLTGGAVPLLCKEYSKATNGTTIFPKTISMIRQYYKRWKASRKIKAAEKKAGSRFRELLLSLSKCTTPDRAITLESHKTRPKADNKGQDNDRASKLVADMTKVPEQTKPTRAARRCVYFPWCGSLQQDCQGRTFGAPCTTFPNGFQDLKMSEQEFKSAKKERLRKENKLRQKENRDKKKNACPG